MAPTASRMKMKWKIRLHKRAPVSRSFLLLSEEMIKAMFGELEERI